MTNAEADLIKQQVQWFYRTLVKSPPDSPAKIAAEFGVSEDAIRAGVNEAKRLLELASKTTDPEWEKPLLQDENSLKLEFTKYLRSKTVN